MDEIKGTLLGDIYKAYPKLVDPRVAKQFSSVSRVPLKTSAEISKKIPKPTKEKNDWIYSGQVDKTGQKSGTGVLLIEDSNVFEGNFVENSINGIGRLYKPNMIIEGNWIDFVIENGKITNTLENTVYEGQISMNLPHGSGKLVKKGQWEYQGEFKEGYRNGQGEIKFKNGEVYRGTLKNDIIEGFGKFIWPDGSTYEGEWSRSKMNGKGVYRCCAEYDYQGSFANGLKQGFGTCLWTNGKKFEGFWMKDKYDGLGTEVDETGKVSYGIWRLGKLINPEDLNEKNDKVSVTLTNSKPEAKSIVLPVEFASFNLENTKKKSNNNLEFQQKNNSSNKEISNASGFVSSNKTDESKNYFTQISSKDSNAHSEVKKIGFYDSNVGIKDHFTEENSKKRAENKPKFEFSNVKDSIQEIKRKIDFDYSNESSSIKTLSREEEKSKNFSESKIFLSKKSLKEVETPKFIMKSEIAQKNFKISVNNAEKTSPNDTVEEKDIKLVKTITFGNNRDVKKQHTEPKALNKPLDQFRSQYRPSTFAGLAMQYVKSEFSDKSLHQNEKLSANLQTIPDETLEDQMNLSIKNIHSEITTENYQNKYEFENALHDVSHISVHDENNIFTDKDEDLNEFGEAVKHLVLFDKNSEKSGMNEENFEKNKSRCPSIFILDEGQSMLTTPKSVFNYNEHKAFAINKDKSGSSFSQYKSLLEYDKGKSVNTSDKDKSGYIHDKEKEFSNSVEEMNLSNQIQEKLKTSKNLYSSDSLNLSKLPENIIKDLYNQIRNRPLFVISYKILLSLDPFEPENTETLGAFKTDWKEYPKHKIYKGYINEKKEPSGEGILLKQGRIFQGSFKNGKKHGLGRLITALGKVYEGYWKNGKKHGFGVFFGDQEFYCGDWEVGLYHGLGVLENPNGRYEGRFEYGTCHGKGVLNFKDGNTYQGLFFNGVPDGGGRIKFGSIAEGGVWTDGIKAKHIQVTNKITKIDSEPSESFTKKESVSSEEIELTQEIPQEYED